MAGRIGVCWLGLGAVALLLVGCATEGTGGEGAGAGDDHGTQPAGVDAGATGGAGTGRPCNTVSDCASAGAELGQCEIFSCLQGRCVARAVEDTTPCDDGDACTTDDLCKKGSCTGRPKDCDDDDVCTTDFCSGAGVCAHLPVANIACDDGDPCTAPDRCVEGACSGVARSCDDGNPCTADRCEAPGVCVNEPAPAHSPCDDGDPCTTADVCVGAKCTGAPKDCDDGEPCTADSCAATGACTHARLPDGGLCEDGDPCTEEDACAEGECAGVPKDCEDGNACTASFCAEDGSCAHTPFVDGLPCDDGKVCTEADACDQGLCAGRPVLCDDGEPCTDDSCGDEGDCVFRLRPDGLACEDGDPCTVGGSCLAGTCTGAPKSCDDGDPCTVDRCNEAGACVSLFGGAYGVACDDGDPCTELDVCGDGGCGGQPLDCDDGDPCTRDGCDAAVPGGCTHTAEAELAPCDDGDPCTDDDACSGGRCVGDARDCADDNPCTADYCGVDGACRHPAVPDGTVCDDAVPCTTADRCTRGTCAGTALPCDDGDPCTTGACDTVAGTCLYNRLIGTHYGCDDGDPCTTRDTCTPTGCRGTLDVDAPGCLLAEDCADGLDDDNDGATDCEDPDCRAWSPRCAALGELCANAIGLQSAVPLWISGDLQGRFANASLEACAAQGGPAAGPDLVYRFVPPSTGRYDFEVVRGSARVRLATDCPATAENCLAPARRDASVYDLRGGAGVFLAVEGPPGAGAFSVQVRLVEGDCADRADEDGDGATDCDDPDCARDPSCLPAGDVCGNAVEVSHGSRVLDTLGGLGLDFPGDLCALGAAAPVASDAVYVLTAERRGVHRFAIPYLPGGAGPALAVLTDCDSAPPQCAGAAGEHDATNVVDVALESGEKVYAVVRGAGLYELAVDRLNVEVDCADGLDGDGDNRTDCGDPDCRANPRCARPGDSCEQPVELGETLPAEHLGSTFAAADRLEPQGCLTGAVGARPGAGEAVHRFAVEETGWYRFTLDATGFDAAFTIARTCPAETQTCLERPVPMGEREVVDLRVELGSTIYAIVDGMRAGQEGVYALTVERFERVCSDGVDGDGDGLADCQDFDCRDVEACRVAGDTCALPVHTAPGTPTREESDTTGRPDHTSAACSMVQGSAAGVEAPDITYSVTASREGNYAFTLVPEGGFEAVLIMGEECTQEPATGCRVLSATSAAPAAIQRRMGPSDGPLFVTVDGAAAGEQGAFVLEIRELPFERSCGDQADDDQDGATDCEDTDCLDSDPCRASGRRCDEARLITGDLPQQLAGDNIGVVGGVSLAQCRSTSTREARDVVFQFTAPVRARYSFTVSSETEGFSPGVSVGRECPISPATCLDEGERRDGSSVAEVLLEQADVVFVAVDGGAEGGQGSFVLNVGFEGAELHCDPGVDEDLDGLSACADADCAFSGSCPPLGGSCMSAVELGGDLPVAYQADTRASNDLVDRSACDGLVSGSTAPDVLHRFVAPLTGRYLFELDADETSFDSMLMVSASCPPQPSHCLGVSDGPGSGELVDAVLFEGEEVFVLVDGSASDTAFHEVGGKYGLHVSYEPFELGCTNGADDDGDGATDCDDGDCKERWARCRDLGDDCDSPFLLGPTLPALVEGDTTLLTDRFEPLQCGRDTRDDARDATALFMAPATGVYRFALDSGGTTFGASLTASRTCPPSPATCIDVADPRDGRSSLELAMAAGQQVYLVVDGINEGYPQSGAFRLRAERVD